MRATDIIRNVLDLIDQVDAKEGQVPTATIEIEPEQGEAEASRFKQIFAMLSNPSRGPLGNSPNEVVADIHSVTDHAGGGVNGPRHPDDIRIKDPRLNS
jgi:hypothetical protein